MFYRIILPILILTTLLLTGCSMDDTGDRRINVRIYEYDPALEDLYNLPLSNQILVWPEEYWENMLSGEYRIDGNASISCDTTTLVFSESRGGYRAFNCDFDVGDPFNLLVTLDDGSLHEYSEELPAVNLQGHSPHESVVVGDSLKYVWNSITPNDGELTVVQNGRVVKRLSGSGKIVWNITDGYSGKTLDLEFVYQRNMPVRGLFTEVKYEYRAFSTLVVP